MKKVLIVLIVVGLGVAGIQLFGSCGLKADTCRTWCSVRHFNSDMDKATCQARCTSDELGCLAGEGTRKVESFFEDMGK